MRDEEISLATIRVVSKFGLKKTTMGDIADEANISRQTLYNAFSTKEAVLQSSVKYLLLKDLAAVKAAWADLVNIEDKLDRYFQIGPISWYDRIQAMPDAVEIFEGMNQIIEPALKEAHSDWIAALAEQLTSVTGANKATTLADFIFTTAKNAKYNSRDRQQLIERLTLLKEMVVCTYLTKD